MVMGGITKHYDKLDACINAINAGIDILIFRDSSQQNIELLDDLVNAVKEQTKSDKIDVLIHSPGGQPDATEYNKLKFN